jgi:hypothetical protein
MSKDMTIRVGNHTRTITTRPVTFVCKWCNQSVTEDRYPGPPPCYCASCDTEVTHIRAVLRQRKRRSLAKGVLLNIEAELAKYHDNKGTEFILRRKKNVDGIVPPAKTEDDAGVSSTKQILVVISFGDVNLKYHIADLETMQKTLCGLQLKHAHSQTNIFTKRDCKTCNRIASERGLTCPTCDLPLINLTPDGKCRKCIPVNQWTRSRI